MPAIGGLSYTSILKESYIPANAGKYRQIPAITVKYRQSTAINGNWRYQPLRIMSSGKCRKAPANTEITVNYRQMPPITGNWHYQPLRIMSSGKCRNTPANTGNHRKILANARQSPAILGKH